MAMTVYMHLLQNVHCISQQCGINMDDRSPGQIPRPCTPAMGTVSVGSVAMPILAEWHVDQATSNLCFQETVNLCLVLERKYAYSNTSELEMPFGNKILFLRCTLPTTFTFLGFARRSGRWPQKKSRGGTVSMSLRLPGLRYTFMHKFIMLFLLILVDLNLLSSFFCVLPLRGANNDQPVHVQFLQ